MAAYILAGTYTKGTKSEGVYSFTVEGNRLRRCSTCMVENPSFLAARGTHAYAATEAENGGAITALTIEKGTGVITPAGQLETPGSGMCHVALWGTCAKDSAGGYISAANYTSGSFVTCSITDTGSLGSVVGFYQGGGSGPVADRQDGPHAHSINPSPGGAFLVGCDLGADRLLVFKADAATGKLMPGDIVAKVAVCAGLGPRHMVFHQSGLFAYVACELGNTVEAYRYDDQTGWLSPTQSLTTLPQGFTGESLAAEIALSPDGQYLYVSNRGANTLAAYRIDTPTGELTPIGQFGCGGNWPRSFSISPDGTLLVVANERSGNLALFARDNATGLILQQLDDVPVPSAVCALFHEL